MSGQPESKEQELLATILDYFQKGEIPDTNTISEIEHDIAKLPIGERAHAYAWLNGTRGRHSDAVRLFKDAMSSGNQRSRKTTWRIFLVRLITMSIALSCLD